MRSFAYAYLVRVNVIANRCQAINQAGREEHLLAAIRKAASKVSG
jgi:hypothetical protein